MKLMSIQGDDMKLCVDCKWWVERKPMVKLSSLIYRRFLDKKIILQYSDQCGHPKSLRPVDGKPKYSCDFQRDLGSLFAILAGLCGFRGRWFEPKEQVYE